MVNTLIFDLARVLLFANDKDYRGDLNPLHKKLSGENQSYNFSSYFTLNEELFTFLETINHKLELYVFTSGSIQNAPEIKDKIETVFRGVFSAEEMGLSKTDSQSYITLTRKLDKNPKEILFIDDNELNIKAASKAGLNVYQYRDNGSTMKKINEIFVY